MAVEPVGLPQRLPVLPLLGTVLFPGAVLQVHLAMSDGIGVAAAAAIDVASATGTMLAVFTRIPGQESSELFPVGVVARLVTSTRTKAGRTILIQSGDRCVTTKFESDEAQTHMVANVELPPDVDGDPSAVSALVKSLKSAGRAVGISAAILEIRHPGELADLIMGKVELPVQAKQHVLELNDIEFRLRAVLRLVEAMHGNAGVSAGGAPIAVPAVPAHDMQPRKSLPWLRRRP